MNAALNTIASELAGEVTTGYLGNISRDRDDRSWYFFAAHPGRVGTHADTWGGCATQEELIIRANRFNEALKRWAAGRVEV